MIISPEYERSPERQPGLRIELTPEVYDCSSDSSSRAASEQPSPRSPVRELKTGMYDYSSDSSSPIVSNLIVPRLPADEITPAVEEHRVRFSLPPPAPPPTPASPREAHDFRLSDITVPAKRGPSVVKPEAEIR